MVRSIAAALLSFALALSVEAQQPVYHAVRECTADPALATMPGGFLMAIPGVWPDFEIAGGGQFVELPDGTARLTGRMFSQSSVYFALHFDIQFSGRVAPGDPSWPPAGGPDLQLAPTAYAPNGPVDATTFAYYTSATGKLVGSRWYEGLVLDLQNLGPIQVGEGANNRNALHGLSGQFSVAVVQQLPFPVVPTGPALLVLDLPDEKPFVATHPLPDSLRTTLVDGRAMIVPGVGADYVFVPSGSFVEHADGHADVTGTLMRLSQLDDAWDLTLQLTSRLDPGEANYPPAGSPALQLLPSAYVQNGGTVDPASWRYYRAATGTLVGRKWNDGGLISLTNAGAVQVGSGANQTNAYVGCYGAFAANIVNQPLSHAIGITGDIELFATTAVFAVLPFPTLVAPAVMPTLSTLTDQGFVVEGDHLAWTRMVAIGNDVVAHESADDWYQGWFKILDNQHVEVHPRPGMAPGQHPLAIVNPVIPSNSIQVQLDAPIAPTLMSEAAVPAWWFQHLFIHSGPVVGPAMSVMMLSSSLVPSVAPGFLSLGMGNGFTDLVFDWTLRVHDPVTGIARADYWNIPSTFGGGYYHLEAIVLDFGDPSWLFAPTNVWSCQY